MPPTSIIVSIAPFATRYDVWLVDVWGVMHNGVAPFRAAEDACRRFREGGGAVVLVSNSPRPSQKVIEQMRGIGVDEQTFDGVVTSGDVTRGLISAMRERPIHHLGPERDLSFFADLQISFATSTEAEVVVVTNLIDDTTETPADYTTTLAGFRRRAALMVCANPDLQVDRGGRIVYCAGSLAQAYEALGGEVIWAGKPHRPIYELALGIARDVRGEEAALTRVLAIGDGVRTDMAGAATIGVDALFVASGLELRDGETLTEEVAGRLFAGLARQPVAAMAALAW